MGAKLKEDISESYGRAEDFVKFYSQQHKENEIRYVKVTSREQIEKEFGKRQYRTNKMPAIFCSLN